MRNLVVCALIFSVVVLAGTSCETTTPAPIDPGAIIPDPGQSPDPPTNPVPENVAPVANAGADFTQDLTTNGVVRLDAGASNDSDGQIVSYFWSTSDPTLSSSEKAPSFTFFPVGATTFRLEVRDNSGATAVDEITVTTTGPQTGTYKGSANGYQPGTVDFYVARNASGFYLLSFSYDTHFWCGNGPIRLTGSGCAGAPIVAGKAVCSGLDLSFLNSNQAGGKVLDVHCPSVGAIDINFSATRTGP